MTAKEKPNILIIDDEPDMRETLRSILKKKYSPFTAGSGPDGLKEIKKQSYDLVLLDLKMPGMDGIAVLGSIKEIDAMLPVIIVTASKELKSAVEAMKAGAEDFITKPFEVEELLAVINKSLEKRTLKIENRALREIISDGDRFCDLIGRSEKIKRVMSLIKNAARTDSTVLISGESGTGKEIAAKALHKTGGRANNAFIALNCAAIPENLLESELFGHERGAFTGALERRIGKFELAEGGTIFLDEIGCMSMAMQAKLLRVLEDRKVDRVGGTASIPIDVRIISATNIDFTRGIAEGKFREDLFYRLNVIPIEMPPLRERREDIPLFISYFIEKFNSEMNRKIRSISPAAHNLLYGYNYPGNVRELKNIIERAVALSPDDEIGEENLLGLKSASSAPAPAAELSLKDACEDFEKNFIIGILKKADGSQTRAARMLNVARTTLASKIKSLGINSIDD